MSVLRPKYPLFVCLIILLLSTGIPGCNCGGEETGTGTAGSQAVAPPRKTDVIVFIREGEVWALNPNNGAEHQVTNNRTTKAWPRISPDGGQVLYQEMKGDGSTTAGIYRVALAGGEPEQVNPLGAYPAWSTDGRSIACVVSNPASGGQKVDDIVIMDAENLSSPARVITDHANIVDMGGSLAVQNLEFSPDGGKYIYFMRGRRSDSRWLARIEVESQQEENVSEPPGHMPDGLASGGFSLFNVSQMEGRRALVSRGNLTGGNHQQDFKLYIRFLEPQLEDSMIEDSPGSINPSLKPDNTHFVYENQGVLYKHNLAGGPGVERIAGGSMPDWGMSAVGPGFDDGGTLTTQTTTTVTTSTSSTTGDSGGGATGDCGAGDIPGTEYIKNGDFENSTSDWNMVDIKKKGVNSVDLAADSGCGKIVMLTRKNSSNDGGLIGLEQPLDLQLARLSSLRLRLISAIDSQALSSDGWYGGETPIFVAVEYTDNAGQRKTWTHGLMKAGSGVNYPERDQTIPAGSGWYIYDSPDLRKAIPDAVRITKVTIGGSGWDFSSRIGLVSLKGS